MHLRHILKGTRQLTSSASAVQSRAAFMTGWPTHVTGHRSLWSLLRSHEPNVLRYLEEAGYDVQWYGKVMKDGNQRGFTRFLFTRASKASRL